MFDITIIKVIRIWSENSGSIYIQHLFAHYTNVFFIKYPILNELIFIVASWDGETEAGANTVQAKLFNEPIP